MATQGDKDVFEVSILLLKVLPNGVELIKDNCFMEKHLQAVGGQIENNNKRVTSPNLP